MFGWRIRLPFGDNSLWYNGKKTKVLEAERNEYGGIELVVKKTQSCWTEEQAEAVLWTNHERAFQVKRTLGKKAEIVESENRTET